MISFVMAQVVKLTPPILVNALNCSQLIYYEVMFITWALFFSGLFCGTNQSVHLNVSNIHIYRTAVFASGLFSTSLVLSDIVFFNHKLVKYKN